MKTITIGKIRGLQQISSRAGVFTICAIDHRGSLETMLEKRWGRKISFQDMVDFKLDLCEALTGHATGILLDPIYGAAHGISSGSLSGNTGLLVSIEATGYEVESAGRVTRLLDGWSVEKIKRMGASAVKILAYYRSDLAEIAEKQKSTLSAVALDCISSDLPFLVEPVAYAVNGEQADSAEFASRKPDMVIETARQLTRLPVDVLKSEFPADLRYEKDKGKLLGYCQTLNEASLVPWVVLSAGVDYPTFRDQVEIACRAGASGFLGGRAIWQEVIAMRDRRERTEFIKKTVVDRFRELADITGKFGTPWYSKYGLKKTMLADITENWYKDY